jgi:hypothetical protein
MTISLIHTYSSILRWIWFNFMAEYLGFFGSHTVITIFFFWISTFFCLSTTDRDSSSRNAHLVHRIWYRICFTVYLGRRVFLKTLVGGKGGVS